MHFICNFSFSLLLYKLLLIFLFSFLLCCLPGITSFACFNVFFGFKKMFHFIFSKTFDSYKNVFISLSKNTSKTERNTTQQHSLLLGEIIMLIDEIISYNPGYIVTMVVVLKTTIKRRNKYFKLIAKLFNCWTRSSIHIF